MATITIPKTEYKRFSREQERLSKAIAELSRKFKILGTLEEFEKLAEWGRRLAKRKGIKPNMVLRND